MNSLQILNTPDAKIEQFQGYYRWLSNFSPCKVMLDGIEYDSVENAYQAAKTLDPEIHKSFQHIKPGHAKKLSESLIIREDWDIVKVPIMRDLLLQKFSAPAYKKLLMETGSRVIEEGNEWGDIFWGVCLSTGKGKNMLGKLIMSIRDNLWLYNDEPIDFDLERMEKACEGPAYTIQQTFTKREIEMFFANRNVNE